MGVGGGVAGAVFDAFLSFWQVAGNAYCGFARGFGEGCADGGFVAGDQAFVAVGAGVGEGQQRAGLTVTEQAGGVLQGGLAEAEHFVAGEQGCAVFDQVLVDVQAVAGGAVDGFGHEGGKDVVFAGDVADDPFGDGDFVGGLGGRYKVELDFHLGGADFVVVVFYRYSDGDQGVDHFGAQVEVAVVGVVAVVDAVDVKPGQVVVVRPDSFGALQAVVAVGVVGGVVDVFEYVELKLHEDLGVVGYALAAHVLHGVFYDVAGVEVEYVAVHGFDVAQDVQNNPVVADFGKGGGHVGDGDHVGLGYVGKAVVGGVKADAFGEDGVTDVAFGDGDVANAAVDVEHHQVEVVDVGQFAAVGFEFHVVSP